MVGLNPNANPTVDAGGPYSAFAGIPVTVSATGSDPNGGSLTYDWDLDDNGSFETPGQTATFTSTVLGAHTIKVRATDPGGLTAVDSATVNVTVTYDSLCALTTVLVTSVGSQTRSAPSSRARPPRSARDNENAKDGPLKAYRNQLDAQTGKTVSAANAALLKSLSLSL